MPTITIKCPNTGKPIPVELEAGEPASDTAAVPDVGVKCPHCHDYHVWRKEDLSSESE